MRRLLSLLLLPWLAASAMAAESTPPASADAGGKTSSAAPLTREQFVGALTRDLAEHFRLEGDLQLDLLRAWSAPARVASSWQVTVTDYPSLAASSMIVRCRVSGDGVAAAEETLVLRANLWRDAWVARQPLASGATFDASLLEARRVDLLRERDALPAAVGDSTFQFARAVSAGRVLGWHDIARRPLVRKGDLVEVAAAEGSLVVTMKALAMENGAQGDAVTVRNLDSQKNFTAFVVDANRVQVRF